MPKNTHDIIVVGAGHNGLTAASYMAKAGLDVLVLEKNEWIGGAAVSRELYPGWKYSNCSYVCSLLRPEIMRDLELYKNALEMGQGEVWVGVGLENIGIAKYHVGQVYGIY